jgi:excisionase family DNA binding protein
VTTVADVEANFEGRGPRRQALPQAREALPPAKMASNPEPARHADLLSWREAAAMLGCSRTTLKRIKAAGEIGFLPIGSGSRPRIWFTTKDIEDYFAAKHVQRRNEP